MLPSSTSVAIPRIESIQTPLYHQKRSGDVPTDFALFGSLVLRYLPPIGGCHLLRSLGIDRVRGEESMEQVPNRSVGSSSLIPFHGGTTQDVPSWVPPYRFVIHLLLWGFRGPVQPQRSKRVDLIIRPSIGGEAVGSMGRPVALIQQSLCCLLFGLRLSPFPLSSLVRESWILELGLFAL